MNKGIPDIFLLLQHFCKLMHDEKPSENQLLGYYSISREASLKILLFCHVSLLWT